MSHIHVCLVSDQPIPNLTTVLHFDPDKVILLSTKDKRDKAKKIEEVIRKHNCEVVIKEILPYDINNVITVSESLINECKNCEVTLNITGGTKIGTLGTFQSFYTAGKPIYYVNTRDNEVIRLYPSEERFPINISISIDDYLTAYGFKIESVVRNDSLIYKRKKITKYLANLAVEDEKLVGDINYRVNNVIADPERASYPIKVKLQKDRRIVELCKMMHDIDLVDRSGETTIKVNNPDTARYLKGGWFEEYVYLTAKELEVNEVKLNINGKWDISGKVSVKNEFDVMIARKNRLFYISCKTVNPDRKTDDSEESVSKEFLYELDALGDRALGLFGKKMLASARPIRNQYVKKRAQSMGITVIDGKNILTLRENLRQWINQ